MAASTIAAIASAPGVGGVGIVRVSGPAALSCVSVLVGARVAERLQQSPRTLIAAKISDSTQTLLDTGLAVYFQSPRSYTGEELVELHTHGNLLILNMLVRLLIAAGARAAEPGEFTRRALLNGKLDLVQAEAVAAMVDAKSEALLRRSVQQLEGHLSRSIKAYRDQLLGLLAEIEVGLDYPDDFVVPGSDEKFRSSVAELRQKLTELLNQRATTNALQEGIKTVIAGQPNVGKSSLLNRLLGEDRALVSPIAGTTRDRVEADLVLGPLQLRLVDTAGLRESSDLLEAMGIEKTHTALQSAALVLYVVDGSKPSLSSHDQKMLGSLWQLELPLILVQNKRDLGAQLKIPVELAGRVPSVLVSATDGQGFDELRAALKKIIEKALIPAGDAQYFLNERQFAELETALAALSELDHNLSTGLPADLWTIALREAAQALGRISGAELTEDLLDRVFSGFCVGK